MTSFKAIERISKKNSVKKIESLVSYLLVTTSLTMVNFVKTLVYFKLISTLETLIFKVKFDM